MFAIRILQVYHIYPALFGGASTVVHQLTRELCKRGNEVSVLTTDAYFDAGRKCEDESETVYRFDVFSGKLFKRNIVSANLEFMSWAKKMVRNYDCIHLHGYRNIQNLVIQRYAKKYGVPYVLQAHGSIPRIMAMKRLKWIYDVLFGYRLLKDASKVIALSQVEAKQYKNMGVPEEKIAIIPNGIDLSEYANLPPKGCFKKKFGINDDTKIVLHLGRIHRIKGIDILVKAFASLTKRLNGVRLKLLIVGPDDGYLREVKTLIRSLNIDNSVLITGPLYGRHKFEAYVDADVYVLPSRYETFPLAVLEAIACGTPTILTENCGIAEYFRDKSGLIVKLGPNPLYEALLEMLLDLDKQNSFRENCKFVAERFDISNTVSKLEKAYEVATKKCH